MNSNLEDVQIIIRKPILTVEQVILHAKIRLLDHPIYINNGKAIKLEDINWKVDLSELISKRYIIKIKNNRYKNTLLLADDNLIKIAKYLKETIPPTIDFIWAKQIN